MKNYKEKYLKYKEKYINLIKTGGTLIEAENCMRDDYYVDDIIFTILRNKIKLENNIKNIKSKKLLIFNDFMNIEEVFNNLNNIESYIEYYKKTLLIKPIKESPNKKSIHNELYNLLSVSDDKKNVITIFMKEKILNNIYNIKKLLFDQEILNKFKNLKEELELQIQFKSLEDEFFHKQNIIILSRYINLINNNLLNKELQTIKDETFEYNDRLWFELTKKDVPISTKITNYKNILLKLLETSIKLKYENILSYQQHEQKVDFLKYDEINTLLLNYLIQINEKHLLLKTELEKIDPTSKITTLEDFNIKHEIYIREKYNQISELIKTQINVNNFIESLRWIVYKFYNLLMKKSSSCKPYKDTITVYEFFNKTTKKLVGVIYFDLIYNAGSRGYIYEFRKRYRHTNIVVPIIYLYIEFKDNIPSLSEIKSSLFHEFGHAIHTILSQNNYQMLSPNNMSSDYVEIMSQIFELYIFEKELIKRFFVIEDIKIKDIPDYDDLPISRLFDNVDFEKYFNDSQNKFLNNVKFLLSCLLEINLKVLSEEKLKSLDIIDYSNTLLQDLKSRYKLPNYVTYKEDIFKFYRIYKYPIYYVYLISSIIKDQIKDLFGESLFDSVKTNIYITDILTKGDIFNISHEIKNFIFKLKQLKELDKYNL
jgi:hypothetical protein